MSKSRQSGIGGYISSLRMQSGPGRVPVLLVEGRQDKAFFECLKAEIVKRTGNNLPIKVVHADDHTVKSRVGYIKNNRERIQAIADAISKLENDADIDNRKVFNKFMGFVDSEFERYALSDNLHIIPNQQAPNRKGNSLRMTLGHSLENYFFQFDLMEEQLKRYCNAPEFSDSALARLKLHFSEIISIACAVSLAARDEQCIQTVTRTLNRSHWRILVHKDSSNPSIELDRERFKDCIESYILEPDDEHEERSTWNPSWEEEKATRFFDKLEDYLKVEQQPDAERWLCHGHIGMRLIRYAYAMLMWKTSGYSEPHPACIQEVFTDEPWIDQDKDKEHLWVEIYSHPKDGVDDVPSSCFFELERKREVLNNLIDPPGNRPRRQS